MYRIYDMAVFDKKTTDLKQYFDLNRDLIHSKTIKRIIHFDFLLCLIDY